jgi:hypothetical protein
MSVTEGQVVALAEFLEVPLPPAKLAALRARVAFSAMHRSDGPVGNMLTRKGETGDFRNHFTVRKTMQHARHSPLRAHSPTGLGALRLGALQASQNLEFEAYWREATAGSALAARVQLDIE